MRFNEVKLCLDIATIAIGTDWGTAAAEKVEGSTIHLTRHHTDDDARTAIGGQTPDRVLETGTEADVITVLVKAIKGGIDHFLRKQKKAGVIMVSNRLI